MTLDDAILLKRIYKVKNDIFKTRYRYNEFIPDASMTSSMYHPKCIALINENLYLVDFTKTAEEYLKLHITLSTAGSMFVNIIQSPTVLYELDSITLEQAQEIIDRNSKLFKQIQLKATENELIEQVNACS